MTRMESVCRSLQALASGCLGAAFITACTSSPIREIKPELLKSQALTTYYVDNRSGSNCSNVGTGTSSSAPWCDFTPVNSRTYGPGDQILLARGASWNQEMQLTGSGTAGNRIELGAYGSGNRPIITRNGNLGLRAGGTLERGVLLNNPSYWLVHDLEVSYAAVGIEAFYDSKLHDTVTIDNVYVHHIRGITEANLFYAYDGGKTPLCKPSQSNTFDGIYQSAGIVITGPYDLPITDSVNDYVLKNLVVSNIEGAHNLTSVATQFCNVINLGAVRPNTLQKARFYNLYLHDDDGGGSSEGCMQSLSLLTTLDSIVYNTWIDRAAGCFAIHGTIAALFSANKNLTLVNNMVTNTVDSGSGDQGGLDFEYASDGVKTLNNYFSGNAGSGIELLAIRGSGDFSSNHLIAGNTFKSNGTDPTPPPNAIFSKGGISQPGNAFIPNGVIQDNLYAEPDGLLYQGDYGGNPGTNFVGFTQSNNLSSSPNTLTNAAADFSSLQGQGGWSYQQNTGGGWSNLTFDAPAVRWAGSGGYPWVNRFNTHPGAGNTFSVARAWSAGLPGTISVRGRALKTELGGDGVSLRLTRNDTDSD